MAGAPKGNQNARRKPWADALRRALARNGGSIDSGLNNIADQVIVAALNGDQWAIKELAERLDGKAAQSVDVTSDGEQVTMPAVIRLVAVSEPDS